MISQKCMRDKRTLLWFYAPGLIGEDISVDNVSSFIKMDLGYDERKEETEINIKLEDKDLGYKGSMTSPFIYIKGGASTVYGKTKDGYAVLAERKEKDHTCILGSMPPVPWQVIQYFAKKAGVHIYSDSGDVVLANQSYISVRAVKAGKRLIRLPKRADLVEILDSDNDFRTDPGKALKRVREIEVDFRGTGKVKFYKMI